MQTVRLGDREVTRFILGGNPFSGFSHQTAEMDNHMRHYFTTACIKKVMAKAEAAGVNAFIGRADFHICRVLTEYWDEGGRIQWFAQTCPEIGAPEPSVDRAKAFGAAGVHVHGGYVDHLFAQGRIGEVQPVVARMREAGLVAGLAGHNPEVFRWAESVKLDVDYYMCCYYNSAHRDKRAEHVPGMKEWFLQEDRHIMTELVEGLSKPVIHYKIMAAGRNDPAEAFGYAARCMRAGDAVCVGIYDEQKPDMVAENVRLLEEAIAKAGRS